MQRRFLFLVITLMTPTLGWAELQYWVSVGSYQQSETAQKAVTQASRQIAENFAVVGTDTAKGYFYRVAAGPFASREAAEDRVRQARGVGFPGAWLWAGEASVFESGMTTMSADPATSTAYEPPSASYESDYSSGSTYSGSGTSGSGTSDYTSPYPEGESSRPGRTAEDEAVEQDLIKRRSEAPELVDEAPEDYKLNKLRRDAHVRPPPEQPPPDGATIPAGVVLSLDPTSPIVLPKYQESQLDMTIDGHLDESVWHEFGGVDAFRVVDPDTLGLPRYATELKMFYTERGLYAAFRMEQPPESLVRRLSGRDERQINRDTVSITLDTSGEGRYGYWVNLALGGNQTDGTVLPERQFSQDWDGAWYGGTQVTDTGWQAEILLPWSQVAMPRETGKRTLNASASRRVAALSERWSMPALPFTQPLFMSALQPLELDQVDPRQQWSVFPYAAVTRDEVEDYTDPKVGADIFWRPSSDFQVTATLKPDFGNVESDDVIVNLSAFETFFPEKRLFFQEGSEIFDATPRAGSRFGTTTMVHTRRIGGTGRAPEVPDDVTVPSRELNQPIELLGAAKVIGQVGPVRYGILGASEDEGKFDVDEINYYQDGSDYGAARFLYEDNSPMGAYRALGLLSTIVAHPDQDATAHGLDFHYLSADGAWKLDGQVMSSDKDDVGTGTGGFVDLRYSVRRGLGVRVGLSHFDDKFDINDLGFVRRNDASEARFGLDYTRSDLPWARQVRVNAFAEAEVNGDGEHTRRSIGSRFTIDLNNQDRVRAALAFFPEHDDDRASRDNGTFVVQGRHAFNLDYITDTSRRVSYQLGVSNGGEEEGGTNYGGRVGFTWRPIDEFNVEALALYQRKEGWLLWQEDRNFTTFDTVEWRPRLSVDYFLTAKQQFRLSAQWVGIKAREDEFFLVPDDVDDLIEVPKPDSETDDFAISRLNLQLRYRWEIAPLSELFVVYTLNGNERQVAGTFPDLFDDALADPVNEQLVVKLRYRLGS